MDVLPPKYRWQFSVRGLLLFTALVAIVLAVAVRMPFFFQLALVIAAITCFLVAVMWTANFATSDLRPRLAMASWIALGAFFSAFATLWFLVVYGSKAAGYELEPVDTGLVLVMAVCGLICFYRAGRAFVRACRFGTGRPLSPHDGAE